MTKIKQFLYNVPIKLYFIFLSLIFIAIIGFAWMYVNVNKILSVILLSVSTFLAIIASYYIIYKITDKKIKKYEEACIQNVKKLLSDEYVRIYIFSSSRLDKSLSYYGKIDLNNTISVYGKNKTGNRIYQNSEADDRWFVSNFYIM